ncbi:MAG: sugar phosphate isomerase/epimerase family protein [Planctomycetota bacterium]
MSTQSWKQRIGVSTLFMPASRAETFFDALDLAFEAGWRCIEIVPGLWHGNAGYPRTRWSVGIDLDEISGAERDRLAKSLSRFPVRCVHSLCVDLNVASRNRGIRHESIRQFMLCADLARDIGAVAATFHIGLPSPGDVIGDEQFVIEKNIDFGKRMADFCEKHGILGGYENLGSFPTLSQMAEIIEKVDSPRFGLHLDVGHAWLVGPTNPVEWVTKLGEHLVNVHMHGTYHRPDRGFENHQSLALDDCTDFPSLLRALAAKGYKGPFILEIIAKNISAYLAAAQESCDILLGVAPEAPAAEHAKTARSSKPRLEAKRLAPLAEEIPTA